MWGRLLYQGLGAGQQRLGRTQRYVACLRASVKGLRIGDSPLLGWQLRVGELCQPGWVGLLGEAQSLQEQAGPWGPRLRLPSPGLDMSWPRRDVAWSSGTI